MEAVPSSPKALRPTSSSTLWRTRSNNALTGFSPPWRCWKAAPKRRSLRRTARTCYGATTLPCSRGGHDGVSEDKERGGSFARTRHLQAHGEGLCTGCQTSALHGLQAPGHGPDVRQRGRSRAWHRGCGGRQGGDLPYHQGLAQRLRARTRPTEDQGELEEAP